MEIFLVYEFTFYQKNSNSGGGEAGSRVDTECFQQLYYFLIGNTGTSNLIHFPCFDLQAPHRDSWRGWGRFYVKKSCNVSNSYRRTPQKDRVLTGSELDKTGR